MSDDNLSHENDGGEGIASLRKQYEQMKKELDAERAELNKYRTLERQKSVSDILKAKGVSPAAAKFYQGDDTSEDAVGKWIEEHADVFGKPSDQSDDANDQNARNAQRVADTSHGNARSVQNGPDSNILGDPEELLRTIKNSSYEDLVKQGLMPQTGILFNQRR